MIEHDPGDFVEFAELVPEPTPWVADVEGPVLASAGLVVLLQVVECGRVRGLVQASSLFLPLHVLVRHCCCWASSFVTGLRIQQQQVQEQFPQKVLPSTDLIDQRNSRLGRMQSREQEAALAFALAVPEIGPYK